MEILINKIKNAYSRVPVSVRKSAKVSFYALGSTLLYMVAESLVSGKMDIAEYEKVVRVYIANIIIVFAVYLRSQTDQTKQ